MTTPTAELAAFIAQCSTAAHHGTGSWWIHTNVTTGQARGRHPLPSTLTLQHRRADHTAQAMIRGPITSKEWLETINASDATRTAGNPLHETLRLR